MEKSKSALKSMKNGRSEIFILVSTYGSVHLTGGLWLN